jgi:AraC family transcriptional regulator
MEAIKMNGTTAVRLQEPRIVEGKSLLIAGLKRSYTHETSAGIPAQWQDFGPHVGHVPGQVNGRAYGVLTNGDDEGNYDYLCGVEVNEMADGPVFELYLETFDPQTGTGGIEIWVPIE